MGSFTNGLLLGLGLTLLFTPKKGTEIRELVSQRVQYLRGIPPENEELKQSVADMSAQVQEVQAQAAQAAQAGSAAQSSAQATANSAGTVQENLNRVSQQAGTTNKLPTDGR